MAQSDPLIGATLDGKYRIEALLGSGSMGTVYRARHLSLESWRAIKVMRAELARDAAFVERFQREARLLEELRHPHLVALYDFAQLPDGGWYIVSEFVEGETLAAYLARAHTLATGEAVRLFSQLADGVAAAHAKGIVHRDLSPDNIMISGAPPDLTAKVLDFGLAKSVLREAPTGAGYSLVVGKVGYAAPEQMGLLESVQEIDARADVFSLAAVLYKALFGRLPWRVDSLQSYVHDLLIRPEADLKQRVAAGVALPWARLFAGALARRCEERTPSVVHFKRDLVDTATRSRIGLKQPAAASPARRAALSLGAVAAVVSIASLLAFGLMRGRAPEPSGPAVPPAPLAARAAASVIATATPEATPEAPTPGMVTRRETPRPTRPPAVLAPAAPAATVTPAIASQPAALPGTLVVHSSPEASVRIDGETRGHTTVTLSLPPGLHALVLTTAEGERHEEDVDLTSGDTVQRDHRFPGFGSLAITSQPWVEVSVDSGAFEQTPFAIARISAGRHTLRGRRSGYRTINMDVEVTAGETRSVSLSPERE